jgi:hypothetical protein
MIIVCNERRRFASGPQARTRSRWTHVSDMADVAPAAPRLYDFKRRWVREVSSRLGRGAKAPLAQRRRAHHRLTLRRRC